MGDRAVIGRQGQLGQGLMAGLWHSCLWGCDLFPEWQVMKEARTGKRLPEGRDG